jgi:hypothetical protein
MPAAQPPVEDPSPNPNLIPTHIDFEQEIVDEVNRVREQYATIETSRADGDLTPLEAAQAMNDLMVESRATFAAIRTARDTAIKSRTFEEVSNPLNSTEEDLT